MLRTGEAKFKPWLGLGLLLMLQPCVVVGQFGMPSTHAPKAPANRADIPYIKCQVCEAMVKQAMTAVKQLSAAVAPGKPLSEGDIIDSLESMCNTDHNAGEWISRYDLQEEGDVLKVVDMGQLGECNVECSTIAKACEQVLDKLDLSDLSEKLYKGQKRATLTQWACYDESKACHAKPPPLPKDREAGPAFTPLDEEKAGHQKLMRNMKAAGLKGTMYDRESIQAQMQDLKGQHDDGDDDDGEDGSAAMPRLADGEL